MLLRWERLDSTETSALRRTANVCSWRIAVVRSAQPKSSVSWTQCALSPEFCTERRVWAGDGGAGTRSSGGDFGGVGEGVVCPDFRRRRPNVRVCDPRPKNKAVGRIKSALEGASRPELAPRFPRQEQGSLFAAVQALRCDPLFSRSHQLPTDVLISPRAGGHQPQFRDVRSQRRRMQPFHLLALACRVLLL